MSDTRKRVWSRYVDEVAGHVGKGTAISRFIDKQMGEGPSQPTVDRWLKGEILPTGGSDVAHFARAFGRNPLEAMVAAGMLKLSEATIGLEESSVQLLQALADDPAMGSRLPGLSQIRQYAQWLTSLYDTAPDKVRDIVIALATEAFGDDIEGASGVVHTMQVAMQTANVELVRGMLAHMVYRAETGVDLTEDDDIPEAAPEEEERRDESPDVGPHHVPDVPVSVLKQRSFSQFDDEDDEEQAAARNEDAEKPRLDDE